VSRAYACIHAHFYQPPRENPWLEEVEPEPSAAPCHDWNERITVECYGPNGAARVLDPEGRIRTIHNNYASLSFNFGPTLLAWMEKKAPGAYARVLEADRESVERFGGHGSALAQPYNHMIMPLATPRDRRTQVAWGMADFRRRYARNPEGMWLPETAVDLDTLEALAEQGVLFTILAPHQAGRVRAAGSDEWTEVEDGGPDTTVTYRQRLPSGRDIALFFYDGPASRAVAFEKLLDDGETLAGTLMGMAHAGGDERARLAHIATDGETYGHHHAHGDMALAVALERLESDAGVRLTNYGQFLAENPPAHEVEIREGTSWSCSHGVERWRSDCGCSTGGEADWSQAWRAPLRDALDRLSEDLSRLFERECTRLFTDPWAARDAYIDVILGGEEARSEFLSAWCSAVDEVDRRRALRCLEMQRNAMLSFTSCGWFFNDLAGIETRQILRYAARAVELAGSIGAVNVREPFLKRLADARGNAPDAPDGRQILIAEWLSSRVEALDVAVAHAACLAADVLPRGYPAWSVSGESVTVSATGVRVVAGIARVIDQRTDDPSVFRFRALARGATDVRIRVRAEAPADGSDEPIEASLEDLRPETMVAIRRGADRREDPRGGSAAELQSGFEALSVSTSDAEDEGILLELVHRLDQADELDVELPLWDLQNSWWWVTRGRGGLCGPLTARIWWRLGFSEDED
jgi:hypothetical protein